MSAADPSAALFLWARPFPKSSSAKTRRIVLREVIAPDVRPRAPEPSDAAAHFAHPPQASILRIYGGSTGAVPNPDMGRSSERLSRLTAQPFGAMIDADGEPFDISACSR
ncbi:hypothetical protein [Palleronia rufa]|uniref:hypothetical protein n=1 Tax=Palleronia rufa TaxID=1530186 RepID=UPI0013767DED|nr:hypothetical protein [Palleronia rufa]